MFELSKKDKKICRMLIDKGLQLDYGNSLADAEKVLLRWRSGEIDNRDAYMALFSKVQENDKHIAWRYNNLGGSRYPFAVAELLADGLIEKSDLMEMEPETRNGIVRLVEGRIGDKEY